MAALRPCSPILAIIFAVCGGDEPREPTSHTTTDSVGIQVVESFAPAWGESGRRIDPAPALWVGREVEGPYQFGSLRHGLLLNDGQIAVVDGLANVVRVFGATGEHVTTFGRSGEGPGEFQNIAGIFDHQGDSLAVFDQGLYRTTIFSRSSGGFRTIQNQVQGNFLIFGLLRNGPFLLFNPGQFKPELQQGLQWDSTDVVAMAPTDGASRVIARLPVQERLIGRGGRREALIPFNLAIQAATADGFYWGTSDRYEIRFYDRGGAVRRILRRPLQPRPVDQRMIDEYVSGYLDWVRGFEGEARVPRYRRRLQEASYGETVPLFGRAFVDDDQRLWVAESRFPAFQGSPARWSVFSRKGVWLGDLEAPDGLTILDARGETVLGIWSDEFDVQYVQIHIISSTAR